MRFDGLSEAVFHPTEGNPLTLFHTAPHQEAGRLFVEWRGSRHKNFRDFLRARGYQAYWAHDLKKLFKCTPLEEPLPPLWTLQDYL